MKTLRVLLIMVITLAMLAACAAPTPPAAAPEPTQAPPTAAPAQKVQISYWMWGSEGYKYPDGTPTADFIRNTVLKDFMDKNPNIEVTFEMKGQESGGTTMFIDTAVAAGEPPDLWWDASFRMAKFAYKGLALPLDPIMTAAKKATLDPTILGMTTRNNSVWGILVDNTFPDMLLVNKTLFEAAGALDLLPQEPDRDWTTEQFEKALAAVTKAPDQYGAFFFAKTPSYDHAMTAYLSPWGCRQFAPGDYTKVTLNSPECIAGLKWMKSLLDKGLVVPGPGGLVDDDMDSYWTTKRVAVVAGGWYELGLVKEGLKSGQIKPPFEMYPVNYPYLAGQKPGPLANLGGRGYMAFKPKDNNPDKIAAILKLVDYLTSPPVTQLLLEKDAGALAGIALVKGTDTKKLYGDNADYAWIQRMQEERGVMDMGWTANNYTIMRPEWAKARQAIWGGEMSVEDALAAYEKKANEVLNQAP